MQSQIQSHEFRELWVLVSQLADEIRRPVLVGVDRSYARSISEEIAVNDGSDGWQLSYEVHGIFIHRLQEEIASPTEINTHWK